MARAAGTGYDSVVIYLAVAVVVIAVLVFALSRRGRRGSLSIRDNDYERRAYGEASQGAPPAQSDANRFGSGSGDFGGGSGALKPVLPGPLGRGAYDD